VEGREKGGEEEGERKERRKQYKYNNHLYYLPEDDFYIMDTVRENRTQ
jgi:hypothetical protein